MVAWIVVVGLAVFVTVTAGLYGLHRLALRLEERGLLYYKHRQPQGTAGRCLVPLQMAVEPQAQHVIETEEQHAPAEDESGDLGRLRRPRFSALKEDL